MRLLRSLLRNAAPPPQQPPPPHGSWGAPPPQARPAPVEVSSVDGFQGREKEAIVCNFVRSNAEGELGFVDDRRRLTVALTRARRFLACIGDSATLSSSPELSATLQRFQDADSWVSVFEEPWSDAL